MCCSSCSFLSSIKSLIPKRVSYSIIVMYLSISNKASTQYQINSVGNINLYTFSLYKTKKKECH